MENTENKGIFADVKDELITRFAIKMMQETAVTKDEIVDKIMELYARTENEFTVDKKTGIKNVPVKWHSMPDGKKRYKGRRVILSDGVSKEGFLSHTCADLFLGQYIGYTSKQIKTKERIFKYPEMKEYFVVDE